MYATHERSVHRPIGLPHRILAFAGFVAVPVAGASAEVCDKVVGEAWMPQQGPVWIFNPAEFPWALLVFTGIMAVSAIRGWPRLLIAGAILLALVGSAEVFADLLPRHDVYRAAVTEGCRSIPTDVADVVVLLMGALGLGAMALRLVAKKRTVA